MMEERRELEERGERGREMPRLVLLRAAWPITGAVLTGLMLAEIRT